MYVCMCIPQGESLEPLELLADGSYVPIQVCGHLGMSASGHSCVGACGHARVSVCVGTRMRMCIRLTCACVPTASCLPQTAAEEEAAAAAAEAAA